VRLMTWRATSARPSWLEEFTNPCYQHPSGAHGGSGDGGEVKCVPYFYILGAFHGGALAGLATIWVGFVSIKSWRVNSLGHVGMKLSCAQGAPPDLRDLFEAATSD